ncbi:hypothetical protein FHETE_2257 [Fusarium heterosporum]|uniref:DUF7587 domain-containing protein n=1 Tax=Fusarium heterosporum TaxID=42747 RepID=A0A8H5WYW8_FUSHE|nr:hypothetical protein FHETE_2257 [Fusarium heterosporum]
MTTAGSSYHSVAESMGGLHVTNNDSTDPPSRQMITDAISDFQEAVISLRKHAKQIQQMMAISGMKHDIDPEDISRLREPANDLKELSQSINNSFNRSMVEHLVSRGGDPGYEVSNLLHHFDERIQSIARSKLDSTDDDVYTSLSKIAKECYKQTFGEFGKLNPREYLVSHDNEDADSTYRSESPGSRLSDEYFASERSTKHSYSQRAQIRREWKEFWERVSLNCPSGPTLFKPLEATSSDWGFNDIPRYLFRAFDAKSSGRNTQNIITSCMSENNFPERSSIDILSLPSQEEASMLLYNHLDKRSFDGCSTDNFMSWSSSFLYVIQYAIWRSKTGRTCPSEVHICVVDTRDFSRGQFARDLWLLRRFQNSPMERDCRTFFDSRLEYPDYDNGEYLSQGTVNLGKRACIFSLQDLMITGISDLYPQFKDDTSARVKYTKRLLALRSGWRQEDATAEEDVLQAYYIATELLGKFDASDMTLMLLSLRGRRVSATDKLSTEHPGKGIVEPAEVLRHMKWMRIMEQFDVNPKPCDSDSAEAQLKLHRENVERLEKLFA